MRSTRFLSLMAISALMSIGSASAQGLLAIQNGADFGADQPLTYSVGVSGGYDALNYKAAGNSDVLTDIKSYFVQGAVGATYTDADKRTPWSMGADFGVLRYLDDAPRAEDTFYNARVSFNIAHQISERMSISNNMYLTYEVEPNYAMGASTTLWNGQYFYGYENFNLSYAWSRRFTTTTSYTVDAIKYEDGRIGDMEDRLSHLIAQQFAYALTPRTKLIGEYRFRMANYDNRDDVDSVSHFVLAGVDHAWSERLSASVRGGAEFFSSDRTEKTAPYAEASLDYNVTEKTRVRWFNSLGFDGSELGPYDSRYSMRSGLNADHQFDKRLSVNGGASYVYSQFDGSGTVDDVTENSILLSAGLNYLLWSNVSLNAQYSYTLLQSDDSLRDFDRNRVSLGVNASF